MGWLIKCLLTTLGLYLALMAIAFFGQRKLLYFPPADYISPEQAKLPLQEITTSEGHLGWYAPPRDGQSVIMVFHGNASDIGSNTHIFRDLLAQGHGVFSVGYPGYPGNAETAPTQQGLTRAAQSQYDWLRTQDVSADRIIFYGTSLGSGVAAQLSRTRPPALLVMDAPFNSVLDMARAQTRILPVRLLLRDTWRSDLALAAYDGPLIWIHGDRDAVIPVQQGRKLYDSYDGPKSAHIISGSGHAGNWALGGRDIVLRALANPSDLTP